MLWYRTGSIIGGAVGYHFEKGSYNIGRPISIAIFSEIHIIQAHQEGRRSISALHPHLHHASLDWLWLAQPSNIGRG